RAVLTADPFERLTVFLAPIRPPWIGGEPAQSGGEPVDCHVGLTEPGMCQPQVQPMECLSEPVGRLRWWQGCGSFSHPGGLVQQVPGLVVLSEQGMSVGCLDSIPHTLSGVSTVGVEGVQETVHDLGGVCAPSGDVGQKVAGLSEQGTVAQFLGQCGGVLEYGYRTGESSRRGQQPSLELDPLSGNQS